MPSSNRHRRPAVLPLTVLALTVLVLALGACGAPGAPSEGGSTAGPGVFGTSEWDEATWQ